MEKLATLATSTTLAGLCFNGLDGIAATARGLLLDANRGMAFVVDTSSAKEFALVHWLVGIDPNEAMPDELHASGIEGSMHDMARTVGRPRSPPYRTPWSPQPPRRRR